MKAFVLVLLMICGSNAFAQSDKDSIYTSVDQMPVFQGDLHRYLSQNIRLPAKTKEENIQGKVVMSFVIDKEGVTRDIKVIRPVGSPEYEQHLIDVIKNMPKWTPGILKGEKVNVLYKLPIYIRWSE
jgi:periplasmic protein TonB